MNIHLRNFCLLLMLPLACCDNEEESTGNPNDPKNLHVEVEISQERKKRVIVKASAEKSSNYMFLMGDGSDTLWSEDGIVDHGYSKYGKYTLEVRSYGESGRYLRYTRPIVLSKIENGELTVTDSGFSTPISYDNMKLVWNDEFNSTSLDEQYWNYEIGTGNNGWGNNELQYYRKENTSVNNGYLFIEARKEGFEGRSYTSSRLTTEGKFDFKYGRVDIRARLPEGQGYWPALWMLGSNFRSVGWPACGETDIMEMIGGGDGKDNVVHGTIHWRENGSHANFGGSTKLLAGSFSDQFHVFSIIWQERSIRWFLNDTQYHVVNTSPEDLSEFRESFFLIFNVAVGGNWPGSPNGGTIFPQQMVVDYVRVFQDL